MSFVASLLEKLMLIQQTGVQATARLLRAMRFNPLMRWRLAGPMAHELLIAPQDISTADPTRANDIYAGYFSFAGHVVHCGGSSPFIIRDAPMIWIRGLNEFGWLKHLRAAENSVSQAQARLFVDDWIRINGRIKGPAWDIECTARRLIAWLSHSPLLLQGCDHAFYQRFMKSLNRQVRYLRLSLHDVPAGMPRLYVTIALCYAAICMALPPAFIRHAMKRLDRELAMQILPDGGHISRHPGALIGVLLHLMPLRQAIIARDFQPSETLMGVINRVMPMLRFFRLGDGSFGKFNGMGDTPGDLVAALLAYDDAGGAPVLNATHSGYQRLASGDVVVLMDAGGLPPRSVSSDMHAGCLSFEFSTGAERIVMNCGHLEADKKPLARIARSTAAHSTLSINEQSSCRFLSERYERFFGTGLLSGPSKVDVSRYPMAEVVSVDAVHDGYVSRFGLKHKRSLSLSADGIYVAGQDVLLTHRDRQVNERNDHQFQIRFHLHPAVMAHLSSPRTVELILKSGKRWLFNCMNVDIALDETVSFSRLYGMQRAQQIVIEGRIGDHSVVDWAFQRLY